MTFSIVACDMDASPSPEWGVAVASKFLAVGSVVGWARADTGAIATQAMANLTYAADGLDLLAAGRGATEVVEALTTRDAGRDDRQLGVVDARGRSATFTGKSCFDWAGGFAGNGFCCQGNILAGSDVVDEMARTFTRSKGELAERLLATLQAGDAAGGDRRGRQSAALLVVREEGGYDGGNDISVDLRVDDHRDPVPELRRLFKLHRLLMPRPEDLEFVDADATVVAELRTLLDAPGGDRYDDELKKALFAFVGTENLEERWTDEPKVERGILDYLRRVKKV